MVISGQRALRHDVAEQLAEVLSDGGAERKRLVERLLRQGQVPPATAGMARQRLRTRLRESVVARVQKGEGINVGVVVCEPFINADGQSGFAADLFRRLASLMQVNISRWELLQLNELEQRLGLAREFDIIVTNLLPTFRRRGFMSFSRPFPHLGVPLSGLVSSALLAKLVNSNIELNVEHLLNEPGPELGRLLRGTRIFLVKGEAGEEFTEAFFNTKLLASFKRIPSLGDDLAPRQLMKRIIDEGVDIFVADVSTCRAVMDVPGVRGLYQPLRDSPDVPFLQPLRMGKEEYSRLALYRIAFGLPKGDHEWKQMVDEAFDCLMSEGIRSLLSLYREYLERDPFSFSPFLIPEDDTVTSHLVSGHFRGLFSGTGAWSPRALEVRE